MRIIGGTLKKRRLHTLTGLAIRPTSDRIRESIFNILTNRVHGKQVLDLFAGTGALGLEALSRGAAAAVFIDRDPSAVSLIRRNLAACKLEPAGRVIRWDISDNLNCLSAADRFELVFMDPPYRRNLLTPALHNLAFSGALNPEADLVIEHDPVEIPNIESLPFELRTRRRYGKTLVSILSYVL